MIFFANVKNLNNLFICVRSSFNFATFPRCSYSISSTSVNVGVDEFFKDYPSVYATGICFKTQNGETIARIGTYWGRGDPLNTFKPYEDRGAINIARTQIESVSFALKQALYEKKTDGIVVKTDSKFVENIVNRYLQRWRQNNFHKLDGSPVKNRDDIEELDRLLQSIKTEVQYVPFEKDGTNVLLGYLREDGVLHEDIEKSRLNGTIQFRSSMNPDEWCNYQNEDKSLMSGSSMPLVYATGIQTLSGRRKNFAVGGVGVCWSDGLVPDHCERFVNPPVTLYRTQLSAIIIALEKALEHHLPAVEIVTNSGLFLAHYRAKWMKMNGEPIANYHLYKRIVELASKLKVKFRYMPDALTDTQMERAKHLATDGMAYPLCAQMKRADKIPKELKDMSEGD